MRVGVSSRILMLAGALLASTSLAQAASNYAHATQSGSDNTATISQGPGDRNEIGTSALAARQAGNQNALVLTQIGDDNQIGTSGLGLLQSSNRNTLSILQSSSGNAVREIVQTGIGSSIGGEALRRNTLSIEQRDGDGNIVSAVTQTRSTFPRGAAANSATIVQSGEGNVLGAASGTAPGLEQSGYAHTAVVTETGTSNRIALIRQAGSQNSATVSVVGDGNGTSDFVTAGDIAGAWGGLTQGSIIQDSILFGHSLTLDISGDSNSFGFDQGGGGNSAAASIVGSANQIGVSQGGGDNNAGLTVSGARNLVYLEQGPFGLGLGNLATVLVTGDDNHIGATQSGWSNALDLSIASGNGNVVNTSQSNLFGFNTASIAISGDDNRLTLDQTGTNTLEIGIWGDNNNGAGAGGFTGAALVLAGPLTPGTITQSGSSNGISLSVGAAGAGSDSNLFAFSQSGNGNTIVGMILGNTNQVAIIQAGNNNYSGFTQNGVGNIIGVNQ